MFWGLIELQRNPVGLVEIRRVSKRQKKPIVLNVDQFHRLLAELKDPYRTMVILAMCSGFRAPEIAGLVWESIDWQNGVLYARQGAVHGRIGRLKTEVSDDEVPMEESFAKALRSWGTGKPMSGLVFPSSTGGPSHMGTLLQEHIRLAARLAGVELRRWHTFRHTYRAILGETDAPIGVQQKLMHHAQISTTMNTYGNASTSAKRKANSKVVEMVLLRSMEQDFAVSNA